MGLLLSSTHLQGENNSLQTVFYADRLYNYGWVNPPKCFFVACEYLPYIVIGGLQCKNLTWESVSVNESMNWHNKQSSLTVQVIRC